MFRLMGIYAHPDDEAFSLAGSMMKATTAGHMGAIVCATRGEHGQISDPALATPQTLGQVREQELRRACAAVGVDDVEFLDYEDGHLAEADEHEAVGRIVTQLRRFHPDVVVTFAANGGYGHVDHIAIHRLTLAAVAAAADGSRYVEQGDGGVAPHVVRKVYYSGFPRERMAEALRSAQEQGEDFTPGGDQATIQVSEMGTPLAEITTQIVLNDAEVAAKMRAFSAHATQIQPNNPMGRGTPEQQRAFLGTESFVLAPPPISAQAYPVPEDDLFAGI